MSIMEYNGTAQNKVDTWILDGGGHFFFWGENIIFIFKFSVPRVNNPGGSNAAERH